MSKKINIFDAVMNNKLDLVLQAINDGQDVNKRDPWGSTLLFYTAGGGDNKMVKMAELLIKHGANLSHNLNVWGDTPLHLAIFHKNTKVTKLFIKHGANVNAKNKDGATPLDIATKNEYKDMIQLLKKHGTK